jgi:hypothetical protein
MLREYLAVYVATFGEVPRLMPLDDEGKAPIIQGTCRLDSPDGRSHLVDGEEAVRQIRDEGARGFALYAGKWDHGTQDLVLVDVDDRESFPYEAFADTLTVLSGSGRGEHFTFRNAGDVANAQGKDDVDGEVRAHNWYCVTPGSIHPSGGVYHVVDDQPIADLTAADLPSELRPGSTEPSTHEVVQLDLPVDHERGPFENDFGMRLEAIRERDAKLDALLTDLHPAGYGYPPPTSEADLAAASKLWFWRFTAQQIAGIMRTYRRRGKIVTRDDYLARTISKTTGGEQMEPDAEQRDLPPLLQKALDGGDPIDS